MKRLWIGAVLAGSLLAAWTCKGDPTSSLRNGPAVLSITPAKLYLVGGSASDSSAPLVVTARDAQLNPVPLVISATSADPTTAKVVLDTTRPDPDSATTAFIVYGVGLNKTTLTISGGGLKDSVSVVVLPLVFPGAISNITPKGGDSITIHSTSVIKFDLAKLSVTFGGGETGTTLAATVDSVRLLVPFSDPAPLTIGGLVLTYAGLEGTFPTASTVHQTGDKWAGDSSWQAAPDITGMLPASGASVKMIVGLPKNNNASVCPEVVLGYGSSGPCMMYKFTVGASTTLNFATSWPGGGGANPDIDIYSCSDSVVSVAAFNANCFEDGGAGATGSDPQATGNFAYPAGTHYFVVEYYAACDGASCPTDGKTRNYYVTISKP